MNRPDELSSRCADVVSRLLADELAGPEDAAPRHAREHEKPLLADHLLTTSALVCCLAYDHPERDALRLAALVHDLPEQSRREMLGVHEPVAQRWVQLLRRQGEMLDRGETPEPRGLDDPAERVLALAHLAASVRRDVGRREEFLSHPLVDGASVDLVYGGATRIKAYVFESARLPEIRGASALLDRINRVDLPALWGRAPERVPDPALGKARGELAMEARDWLQQDLGMAALDAPECVLYASGGNILALAPRGKGEQLAAAIERRYTQETQVAGSVAV